MQLTKRDIYNRCVAGIAAFIWVFGLLVAGSDSIYMPWLNAVGALFFLGASLWLGRVLPKLEAGSIALSPISVRTKGAARTKRQVRMTVPARSFEKKQNLKVNTRYAGGWSTV